MCLAQRCCAAFRLFFALALLRAGWRFQLSDLATPMNMMIVDTMAHAQNSRHSYE